MRSILRVLLFSVLLMVSSIVVSAQNGSSSAANQAESLKTVVVSVEAQPDSVIAVPPATSVAFSLNRSEGPKNVDSVDLRSWVNQEASLNGLGSSDLMPWHILITYDQFDEDGDNVHSGVYEEFWAGPKKFKRSYRSDDFNQTDYATAKGLYRVGDQRWPNPAESNVRTEVIRPFFYAATLRGVHTRKVERSFGAYKLECVLIEKNSSISDPTQYCFEPDSYILRYARGSGWLQTVYNQISLFQGRNVARQVDVTDGGKPYLKLRVEKIELLPQVSDADFLPPPDAIGPLGGVITGVNAEPRNVSTFPRWPDSLRAQHFIVKAEIVIGKDGHVVSARAVSGPSKGYKACEDAVKRWVFNPFLVLDKPVEVEEAVECSNN